MRLSVLIPSRCRPYSLQSVIGSLHHLASGHYDVTYCVGLDDDDPHSSIAMQNLPSEWNVRVSLAERPGSLGSIYNRLAAMKEADMYVLFADDLFPLCVHWDHVIAVAAHQYPRKILAWNDVVQRGLPTYPIIPGSWYEMNGLFTEHFPFWFDDSWLAEVHKMATGENIIIPHQLAIAGRKGKTERMKDLTFWWEFFTRTRIIRTKQAKVIAEKLGLSFDPIQAMHEAEARDEYFKDKLAAFEQIGGDEKDAVQCYKDIKSRAEQFILQNAL